MSSSLFAIPGSHITISMNWKDQGWGNRKGNVGLFTAFADGVAVYRTEFRGGAPHSLTAFSDTIQLPAGMKDLEFKYMVGNSGGHSPVTMCTEYYDPVTTPNKLLVGSTTDRDRASYFSNYGTCVHVQVPASHAQPSTPVHTRL